MTPAMLASWLFGGLLAVTPSVVDWSEVWPWTKLAGILGMTWFHIWCVRRGKDFIDWRDIRDGRHYRLMNEVPTLLLVIIVLSVVVKPG